MTFERAWALLFLILPALWAWREWRNASHAAVLLKAAAFTAIVAALAQPRVTYHDRKVALAVLVDTSASVTAQDLDRASKMAASIERERRNNSALILPFASQVRDVQPEERERAWNFRHSSGNGARGTNLEAAVRHAIASLPSGRVPRVALVSDGQENLGSAARAIFQAQHLGIPVDTIPLAGRAKPGLHLSAIVIPAQVFTGEKFPIDITVQSPGPAKAAVEINAEGKTLGKSQVDLVAGANQFRVFANVSALGAIDLAGVIRAEGLGEAHFEQAVTMRRPRVLLVSRDPASAESHLMRTLEANQFEVERAASGLPDTLDTYQLIVINNWDLEAFPPSRKAAIENFVKQGGGLAWIAGERNQYREKEGPEDPLERTLPAKLAPPRTPEGTCVVLIVDKSSSMEGKKMELARLAAIGVIDNLRPVDLVGVLIFDNSFQWAVPIRRAEDRSLIKRLVAGITPDGGTQIAPALSEAYRRVIPIQAVYKHVVLLTDGISEEGDSLSLARDAEKNKVTISTVGLGQDVNRAYLEKIAAFAHGKSYFLSDPSGLEQILLKDVMEHTGSTAVEKLMRPVVVKQADVLNGVSIEDAPPLYGYVRFTSRGTADTVLNADRTDPLFVRWQYGLGRASVFTSDAKNRWAARWLDWAGYDRFWTNVFRDLLPHSEATEATAEYDRAHDELVVDYRLARHVVDPAAIPDIFAFGPDGFQQPVTVTKLATGSYRARVSIGGRQGLFRVRPLNESRAFPEIGFYREQDELLDYGANELLLRQIAEATGGRYKPPVRDLFDSGGRSIRSSMDLWPGLLALAVLLNIGEVFLRKWRGLVQAVREMRGTARATAASPSASNVA
jgi:Mg-chelatase subunit ChlD